AEDSKAPGLVEVMRRREPRDGEQLEQRLARERLRPERLVRPAGRSQLFERHPSRAETVTVAPARLSSAENGQPSSALASAACSAASSRPSTRATNSTLEPVI